MRALPVAMLFAVAYSALAEDAATVSRFTLHDARVEPGTTAADHRFRLQSRLVRHEAEADMEALGFRLHAKLVGKGSGCTVPTAIFADGFE